jgi:hypothetical protein
VQCQSCCAYAASSSAREEGASEAGGYEEMGPRKLPGQPPAKPTAGPSQQGGCKHLSTPLRIPRRDISRWSLHCRWLVWTQVARVARVLATKHSCIRYFGSLINQP